jgi:hypothetical protein
MNSLTLERDLYIGWIAVLWINRERERDEHGYSNVVHIWNPNFVIPKKKSQPPKILILHSTNRTVNDVCVFNIVIGW